MTTIIDGKAIAAELRSRTARDVQDLSEGGCRPGLAVILMGEDPASQIYVRNKLKQTAEAGMQSFEYLRPASTSQSELIGLVRKLNLKPAASAPPLH
jgi:methylenetetrahydrofolate dehydrogenase (NADP+)/methenyltetrahydrofolate cyclohydrolase